MADEDYDYCADGGDDNNEDIDYNAEEINYNNNNEDGLNLEDNFIEAEQNPDPVEAYRSIIELEASNSNEYKWTYKSYEKLCQYFIKKKNFEEFAKNFEKLFEYYSKVDDYDKQDTIRNMTFALSDIKDVDFDEKVFVKMLETLKDKEIERAYIDVGLEYSKKLFERNKYDKLAGLINSLMNYLKDYPEDEIFKSMKLELIAMDIQLCNVSNDAKKGKRLYFQASKLMQDQIFSDKRLSAIISEEGGKLDIRQKEYEKALQKFKYAFQCFKECGSNQAITLLKYAFIASIITRNRSIIVSPDEAKNYSQDAKLMAFVELFEAFEQMNFNKINLIWKEKIVKNETDLFIKENFKEILHHIRLNYLFNKLRAYKNCKLESLLKELSIKKEELITMLLEMNQMNVIEGRKIVMNFIDNVIHVPMLIDEDEEKKVGNFAQWIKLTS